MTSNVQTQGDPPFEDNTPTLTNDRFLINELLCFLSNKIDILPSETIIQLCEKTYNDQQIEYAKRQLFDLVTRNESDGLRYIKRQGQKKKTQNLDDILKKLHELGDDIPVFVAKDLSNLPPISIDSVDVSVLLRKIESLSDQVSIMKAGLLTQSDTTQTLFDLCNDLTHKVDNFSKVPQNESTDCERPSCNSPPVDPTPDNAEPLRTSLPPVIDVDNQASNSSSHRADIDNMHTSWTQVVKVGRKMKTVPEFRTTVTTDPKRSHPLGIASRTAIKSVKKTRVANIFASRFEPEQDPKELESYFSNLLKVNVTCKSLPSKFPDYYSSFHIHAVCDDPSIFMNPDIWPEGIYFRWYKPESHTTTAKRSDPRQENRYEERKASRSLKDNGVNNDSANSEMCQQLKNLVENLVQFTHLKK